MISEILYIAAATVMTFILFVAIDMLWKLPAAGGVSGAHAIGNEIERSGGDLNGGWMMGNIVTSPDASGGTLLAACGYWIAGVPGGIGAAVLVFIGARICADKGYAGTSGAIAATVLFWILQTYLGFPPETFIGGTVIAVLLIQGISPKHASKMLGAIWRRIS